MDFKSSRPVKRALPKPVQRTAASIPEELLESGKKEPLLTEHSQSASKKSRLKWWIIGGVATLAVLAAGLTAGVFWWYNDALQPLSSSQERIRIVIEPGATPDQIAQELQEKGVIKSSYAFGILVKQENARDKLQAGTYLLSPSQSVREVLSWLVEGKVDTFNVTILPGLTLAEIKEYLVADGFTAQEIDAAYAVTYDHPLLADKPADVNLEGYIYPDTYQISSETTAQDLLIRSFDEFYALIQKEDLQSTLAARGFNLHQGITLASIIGKEVNTASDKRQVAQVFEKRLDEGIELGSDVTFMYAAELTGQQPTPSLNSPYNTRLYKELPPGAIANFTIDNLEAVANPAPGDYLYFVAGDDGTTYFSKTEAEHEANVERYCTKLCQ